MISTDSSHKKKSKKRKLNETGDDEILEQEEQIAVKFKTKKKNVVDGEADDVSVTLTPDQAAKKRGGKKVKEGNPKSADSEGAFYQGKSSSEHSATKTSHRKKKSKDKSSVDANASVLNDSAIDSESLTHSHNNEEDSAVATKKKKKGKRDKTQNEEQSSVSYDKPSSDDLPAVTSHRKKKSSKDKSLHSVEASDPVKKPKREKAKLTDESSLGVIDTDILQQAETNLGLPMVDKLERDSVVHSLDTTSGEEPVKKKKKKRDKTQTEIQSNTPNEKSRNDRAIEYLRLWGSNRKAWKFNKMMQVQLLHIMYDKLLVSNEDFEILLLYLDGLKGKGREKTKESAKKILDEGETGTTDADKEERARQVYQMLS